MIVDGSILLAYLCGDDPRAERALAMVAADPWVISPLALATVLAPVAGDPEAVARAQHVLHDLGIEEADLTSRAGVPLARLTAESGLPLHLVATLQLALERDAAVLTLDPGLAAACRARGLVVRPGEAAG